MLLFCNYPILISVTISVSLAENEKRYPPRLLLSSRSWAAIQTVTVLIGFWPFVGAAILGIPRLSSSMEVHWSSVVVVVAFGVGTCIFILSMLFVVSQKQCDVGGGVDV